MLRKICTELFIVEKSTIKILLNFESPETKKFFTFR
jgi:hypothetical protein